ncbi:hypothetical protein P7C71_g1688, partial [Lecanoromycetidae sp. Uapishka_2]
MLALPLLVALTASLASTTSAVATSTVTVTSVTYLALEECCAHEPTFAFGHMASKPAEIASPHTEAVSSPSETAYPVTEAHSSPSATLSTPSDQCTAGPSVFGADCSATGYCCPPASCDVATLKCINPDDLEETLKFYFAIAGRCECALRTTPFIIAPQPATIVPPKVSSIHYDSPGKAALAQTVKRPSWLTWHYQQQAIQVSHWHSSAAAPEANEPVEGIEEDLVLDVDDEGKNDDDSDDIDLEDEVRRHEEEVRQWEKERKEGEERKKQEEDRRKKEDEEKERKKQEEDRRKKEDEEKAESGSGKEHGDKSEGETAEKADEGTEQEGVQGGDKKNEAIYRSAEGEEGGDTEQGGMEEGTIEQATNHSEEGTGLNAGMDERHGGDSNGKEQDTVEEYNRVK